MNDVSQEYFQKYVGRKQNTYLENQLLRILYNEYIYSSTLLDTVAIFDKRIASCGLNAAVDAVSKHVKGRLNELPKGKEA
jgi:hypothetical protein